MLNHSIRYPKVGEARARRRDEAWFVLPLYWYQEDPGKMYSKWYLQSTAGNCRRGLCPALIREEGIPQCKETTMDGEQDGFRTLQITEGM